MHGNTIQAILLLLTTLKFDSTDDRMGNHNNQRKKSSHAQDSQPAYRSHAARIESKSRNHNTPQHTTEDQTRKAEPKFPSTETQHSDDLSFTEIKFSRNNADMS